MKKRPYENANKNDTANAMEKASLAEVIPKQNLPNPPESTNNNPTTKEEPPEKCEVGQQVDEDILKNYQELNDKDEMEIKKSPNNRTKRRFRMSRKNNTCRRASIKTMSNNEGHKGDSNKGQMIEPDNMKKKNSIDQSYRSKRISGQFVPIEKRKDGTLIDYGVKVPTRKPKNHKKGPTKKANHRQNAPLPLELQRISYRGVVLTKRPRKIDNIEYLANAQLKNNDSTELSIRRHKINLVSGIRPEKNLIYSAWLQRLTHKKAPKNNCHL